MRSAARVVVALLLSFGCTGPDTTSGTRATISGRVRLNEALPGANDYSRVRVDIGRGEGGVPVDAEGNFEFADIEPDVYTLQVTYTGGLTLTASGSAYLPYSTKVVARAGGSVSLGDVILTLGQGAVDGALTLTGPGSAADSPDDAVVLLEDQVTQQVLRTTVSNGVFNFPNTPVGRYRLTVEKPGYAVPATGVAPAAQAQCGADVVIEVDGAEQHGRDLTLERARPSYVPGGTSVEVVGATTWLTSETSADVRVLAEFPVSGRVWVEAEGAEAPEYTTFQTDGYVVELQPNTRNVIHAQFRDGCGHESEEDTLTVIHDVTAPTLADPVVHGGAAYVAQSTVGVVIQAADALSDSLQMVTALCPVTDGVESGCERVDSPAETDWQPYQRDVVVALEGAEGLRRFKVRVRDRSGNVSEVKHADVTWDATPPTVARFQLNGGTANAPTASALLNVALEVSDAGSDVTGLAIAESPISCASAAFTYSNVPELVFPLTPGEGRRQLYLCARDGAGNVTTAIPSDNAVVLDTARPSRPSVILGDGSGWSQTATAVEVLVTSTDDVVTDYAVVLGGDAVPTEVPLLGSIFHVDLPASGSGPFTVTAWLVDGAGNVGDVASAAITVDLTAPVVHRAVAGNPGPAGGTTRYITDALLQGVVSVECTDDLASADQLRLLVEDLTVPKVLYDAGYRSQVDVDLDADATQGERELRVTCRDRAGRSSSATTTVTVDTTPPTVTVFQLNDGTASAPTASTLVNVTLDVSDAGSDVTGLAVAESAISCTTAAYTHSNVSQLVFPLTPGDGLRRLYLCARDGAGNVTSAIPSDNAVLLDTARPNRPGLVLGDGTGWSAVRLGVPVLLTSTDDVVTDYTVVLGGDLALPVGETSLRTSLGAITIDLPEGSGPFTVTAWIEDGAGNTSDATSEVITVDATPPVVQRAVAGTVGPGGGDTRYITDAQGRTTASVECTDDLTAADQLLLTVVDTTVAKTLYDGAYRSQVDVDLDGDGTEGTRQLEVTCRDRAGNPATAFTFSVVVDVTPPALDNGELLVFPVGASDREADLAPTRTREVAVRYRTTDATAGVHGALLSDTSGTCSRNVALYQGAPSSPDVDVSWTLGNAEGAHHVYLCLMDLAGNVTPTTLQSRNRVTLDTVAPTAGTLELAGGRLATNGLVVTAAIVGATAESVVFSGPVVEAGQVLPFDGNPLAITLVSALDQADLYVSAQLVDAAGNRSALFFDSIRYDRRVPEISDVILAGGLSEVNNNVISVDVRGDTADHMMLWVDPDGTCDDVACNPPSWAGWSPFVAASTISLGTETGAKLVCARFCDEAGNSAGPFARNVTLGTFHPRPVPELLDDDNLVLEPRTLTARLDGVTQSLTIRGQGFSSDTEVSVGDYTLRCSGGDAATADMCETGAADGSCDATCQASCGTSCVVDLPQAVLRRADTYVVSLSTPAPGGGTSTDVAFFVVYAPTPSISRLEPRGITQLIGTDGFPIPQTVALSVCARDVMDNAVFQLGTNVGTVISREQPAAGTCPNATDELIRVSISTAAIFPEDQTNEQLSVVNPAPGGGVGRRAFGVNPVVVDCPDESGCLSNLRYTRTSMLNDDGVAQAFAPLDEAWFGNLTWTGGTAATWHNGNGELLARFTDETHGGTLPAPFAPAATLTLEDTRGTGPATRLASVHAEKVAVQASQDPLLPPQQGRGRTTGQWLAPVSFEVGEAPQEVAFADFNEDGNIDVAVATYQEGTSVIRGPFTGAANTLETRINFPGFAATVVATADVDMDGHQDLIYGRNDFLGAGTQQLAIRKGRGDGTFSVLTNLAYPYWDFVGLEVADFNRDGTPDLLTLSDSDSGPRVALRLGSGDGTFGSLLPIDPPASGSAGGLFLVAADLNRDGAMDYVSGRGPSCVYGVAGEEPAIVVWRGDGTGGGAHDVYAMPDVACLSDCVVGDMNLDGARDVVCSANPALDDSSVVGTVIFVPGRGDGTLNLAARIDTPAPGFAGRLAPIVDFTGDGHPDLVMGSNVMTRSPASCLKVMAGDSTGSFTIWPYDVDGLPWGRIGIADVDNNGTLDTVDLALAGTGKAVIWGLTRADGNHSTPRQELRPTPGDYGQVNALLAADINQDNLTDFVALGLDGVVEFDNQDGHSWKLGANLGAGPERFAAGDFNADGLTDMIWQGEELQLATRASVNDPFTITTFGVPAADQRFYGGGLTLADFNNDGFQDVAHGLYTSNVANPWGVNVYLWDAVGGTFAAPVYTELPEERGNLPAVGDLNQDGTLDLVIMLRPFEGAPFELVELIGNGAGGFTVTRTGQMTSEGGVVTVADFDQNGHTDVLVVGLYTGRMFLQTAPQVWEAHDIGRGLYGAADLNGDGLLDLYSNGRIQLAISATEFSPAISFAGPPEANAPVVADLDNDGAPDLALSSHSYRAAIPLILGGLGDHSQELQWERNNPPGIFIADGDDSVVPQRVEPGEQRRMYIRPAQQVLDRMGLRVILTGDDAALSAVTLTLDAPNGATVDLSQCALATPSGGRRAIHLSDEDCSALQVFRGLQPAGVRAWDTTPNRSWTLHVTAGSGAVTLEDFTVLTHGYFRRASPGTSLERPENLTLVAGAGAVFHGTTRGFPSNIGNARALSTPGPDHLYQFVAPANATYEIRAAAGFDAAVEMRQGPCTTAQPITLDACSDGSPACLRYAVTANETYCLVVDGQDRGTLVQSGEYDLHFRQTN
ncbi:MAG: FG-GAP-like repeat-containing protein [Myxococcota bacterium]